MCVFFLIHSSRFRKISNKRPKTVLNTTFYVDVNVFYTHFCVFLNADVWKTKQQLYGFLFISMSCIASKYICTQKIKRFTGRVYYVHMALNAV